jgi:hypothetical protein
VSATAPTGGRGQQTIRTVGGYFVHLELTDRIIGFAGPIATLAWRIDDEGPIFVRR